MQSGRTLTFPAASIKNIKPLAVNWPAKKIITKPEKKKEPTIVVEKEDTQSSDIWKEPWMLALQGLTPLWSGMYQSEENFSYGYVFTILEILAIANLSPWLNSPAARETDFSQILLYSFIIPPPRQTPGPNIPGSVLYLTLLNQVESPSGGYMDKGQFDQNRTTAGAILVAVLVTDGIVSFLYGNDRDQARSHNNNRSGDYSFQFDSQPETQQLIGISAKGQYVFWRHEARFAYRF